MIIEVKQNIVKSKKKTKINHLKQCFNKIDADKK